MANNAIHVKDFRREVPGELVENTWFFPAITSVNSHGKATSWRVYVRMVDLDGNFIPIKDEYFDSAPIVAAYGWINVDSGLVEGKIRDTVPTIVKNGKNLGKKSATNVWTQALRDAYGLHNKQSKKVVNPARQADEAIPMMPPMLAQSYFENPVEFGGDPVFMQRKYNGVRIVTVLGDDDAVIMYSRRKNIYPGLNYIKAELQPVLAMYAEAGRRVYLDGEVYKHGVSLQKISGQTRREDREGDVQLDYMIYDCFIPDEPELTFAARREILGIIFDNFQFAHCQPVETFRVENAAEVDTLFRQFLAEEFEGAMVRLNSAYRYSNNEYHSRELLKMKPTHDAEFKIVGWSTGEKGKAAAAIMLICEVPATDARPASRFPVTPAAELPDRIALAKKMTEIEANGATHFANHWEGRPLIVYYDEMSEDNVPLRARTKMEIRTWD